MADYKETAKEVAERAAALKSIEASEAKIASLVNSSLGATKAQVTQNEKLVQLEEARIKMSEKQISTLDKTKSKYQDISSALQSSVKLIKTTKKEHNNLFKSASSVETITAEIVANEKALSVAKLNGNKQVVKDLKLSQEKLKALRDITASHDASKKSLSQVNATLQSSVKGIEGVMEKLPGGGMLMQLTGVDKLGEGIEKAMTQMVTSYAAAGGGIKGMAAGAKAFNVALLANPMMLIAAAAIGLLMTFKKLSHTAHDLSTATGLTYAQTKKIVKASNDVVASSGNQLSLQKDILAVMTETVKEFGVMGMMSAKQAGAVSDIGIAFGYGAEQAGKVNTAFMRMGATADEAANTQRDLAAEAMKAGVSVGAVTADIAENSKATAKYFGGNVKALKKAAIEAAKMGVSLSTMAKVSDGLLDFEKSISAQFELQALTGKNMNLDGARRLALEGDIAGATAAVLDQVGSIAEFDNMSYLGRKKLAEASGMDVDELQKSLIIKSKMGNLNSEQLAQMNSLGLSAAELTNMSSEDLQKKLAQKQATEKIAAQFAAMKATLVNALMPAAEAMMGVFVMLSPVLKGIAATMGFILAPLKQMGKILSGNTSEMSVFQKILGGVAIAMTGLYTIGKLSAAVEASRTTGMLRRMSIAKARYGMSKTEYALAVASKAIQQSVILQTIKHGAIKAKDYAKAAGALAAEKAGLALTGAIKMGQYALAGAHWVAEKAHLGIRIAMEQGALAIQFAINSAKAIGNVIAAGAIVPLMAAAGASIAAAIPAIFTGLGMIPFGLGIPIAFAAVAGLIGLVASMSKGNDVLSGPSGGGSGGGYGSRVMFGPEGAISFNNKDTIVAGTDLFGQANDAVFAPKGAMKMNDGAINADMPDPPEAKIVGIAATSVAKLSMGIAAAIGSVVAPAFIAALALSMPVIALTITTAVAAGMALSMPFIGAAIVGGITAGALATALIPRPVLILNPVLPTFETNPVMMMGSMLGGIGNLLGGGKDDTEDPVVAKLDQVIMAIQNMEINMDGQKVGALTRLADTFRRG
tara:strand:+ start:1854 stop:4970 length:3117 start_codon:yes stop_codon:yes gene_type:complete